MKRVLIDLPVEPECLDRLRALPGVEVHQAEPAKGYRELPTDLLGETQVLLCKLPPLNFDAMRSLELLQLGTVGHEHLKQFDLASRPFPICNARGVFDTAIAEWNVGMMINLVRELRTMIRQQEQAHWERHDVFQQEIRGKVVGLWGYGGIGRETARLARALGMTVHVLTRSPICPRLDTYVQPGSGDPDGTLPHRVFPAEERLAFLAGLDFLVLALPHNRDSDGMVGEAEFRAMKPGALLLNPARGPIVQESALIRALREGWIAGAALDTHYAYPLPREHPLWAFPNVILTPHISGADRSAAYPGRIGELLLENVRRLLENRPLLNRVSRAELQEAGAGAGPRL